MLPIQNQVQCNLDPILQLQQQRGVVEQRARRGRGREADQVAGLTRHAAEQRRVVLLLRLQHLHHWRVRDPRERRSVANSRNIHHGECRLAKP